MQPLSSSNPIIYHPPISLEMQEMKMQSLINRIAKRIIRQELHNPSQRIAGWMISETQISTLK